MNVQLDIGLSYTGPSEGLEEMIDQICYVLVEHGFGTDPSNEDAPVKSIIAVRERSLVKEDEIAEFLTGTVHRYMPMKDPKEETDERRTDDQREAGSEGSLRREGEDRSAELQ